MVLLPLCNFVEQFIAPAAQDYSYFSNYPRSGLAIITIVRMTVSESIVSYSECFPSEIGPQAVGSLLKAKALHARLFRNFRVVGRGREGGAAPGWGAGFLFMVFRGCGEGFGKL